MKKHLLILLVLVFCHGCTSSYWEPVIIPKNIEPYRVFPSAENLGYWTEIPAGAVLVEESQVYLTAKQEYGVGYGGGGLFYPTTHMNTDELDSSNKKATLSIRFNKYLEEYLSKHRGKLYIVDEKEKANIILQSHAFLHRLGNGFSHLSIEIKARFIDSSNGETITKEYSLSATKNRKINGVDSWSSNGAENLISEARRAIPLLIDVFYLDLTSNIGKSLTPENVQKIKFVPHLTDEIFEGIFLREYDEYILMHPIIQGYGFPLRRSIVLLPKSIVIDNKQIN